MDQSYESVKAQFEKACFKLMNPALYGVETVDSHTRAPELQFKKRKDMRHNYANVHYEQLNSSGRLCKVPFLPKWVADKTIRTYSNVDFLPPPLVCPSNVYNLYTGLAAEALCVPEDELERAKADGLPLVLDHLHFLCNHEAATFNYVLSWLAQIVQQPGKLSEVMVCFSGAQGPGTNILVDWFGNEVLGAQYYLSTSNTEHLFTRGFLNKLLVNLDISVLTGRALRQLATQGTSDTFAYKAKGIDVVTVRNCARLLMTTEDPSNRFNGEAGGPQHVCIRMSSEKVLDGMPDAAYFATLAAALAMDGVKRAFFDLLMARDIAGWQPVRHSVTELAGTI